MARFVHFQILTPCFAWDKFTLYIIYAKSVDNSDIGTNRNKNTLLSNCNNFMNRKKNFIIFCMSLVLCFTFSSFAAQTYWQAKLKGSASAKRLVETAADHSGSLLFKKSSVNPDIVHLIAFCVEFDSSHADDNPNTTGGGTFGVYQDAAEQRYYTNGAYQFDQRPHDQAYFENQLLFVKKYFSTVSHGNLQLDYTVFYNDPATAKPFFVPRPMSIYSPGSKGKTETWDSYYTRKTIGLLKFVRDAILNASADTLHGPFAGLHADKSTGQILDSANHKTVFLIFHAGASALTDGGTQGSVGANTPSDFTDAFVTPQYFSYFKDSLGRDTIEQKIAGVKVKTSTDSFLVDEIMMCSETSNQDSLNWGIHGILVNQVARQLGIPDLYSTSSGMTAVGAFCIMDPYGYSAAQGFIPPWPSAWVRAFMGWDTPRAMSIGQAATAHIKAVSAASANDTTILLVPINDHEYYLMENRQRNLSGNTGVFKWDTSSAKDTICIDPSFPVNIPNVNVVDTVSPASHCIISAKNFDAGLPASGVLVWHIDEQVIRDKLTYDMINADSNYKAVTLEEADGINDIGIAGTNLYNQSVFDYGQEEDVFPHITYQTKTDSTVIDSMGPWTRPSTHANDGGQTYLTMKFSPYLPQSNHMELSRGYKYLVRDFADSVFTVSVAWNYLVKGWPKRMVQEPFFDPAVFGSGLQKKLAVVSKSGKLYVFPADSAVVKGRDSAVVTYQTISAGTTGSTDTVLRSPVSFTQLGGAYTFPTVIDSLLLIPSASKNLYIAKSISDSSISLDSTQAFPSIPSSYICELLNNHWAIGLANGKIALGTVGTYTNTNTTISLPSADTAVNAIAVMPLRPDSFACIQANGVLSICSVRGNNVIRSTRIVHGFPPYTIVCGDIDKDSVPEIIVSDSRKVIRVYKSDLALAAGWAIAANVDSAATAKQPYNTAPVSLADINGDGYLDIISGDNNGVYAYNYKGSYITGWPYYIDNRYSHGTVSCSPAITHTQTGPLVIYHSPSGENVTWEIDSIIYRDPAKKFVIYQRSDKTLDTLNNLSSADSALVFGDSLITPYILPGGFIDAINSSAKRPLKTIGTNQMYSNWPLTVGSAIGTSPLLNDFDSDGKINLIGISISGMVYRWKLDKDVIGDSLIWPQLGYNGARQFAYLGATPTGTVTETAPISFHSYPNPTNGNQFVFFKYKFSAPATNVRLDVYTFSGLHVLSKTGLSGSYPDWNELEPVSLATFGPGVYRCRLEADMKGKKQVQFWKMAVVK